MLLNTFAAATAALAATWLQPESVPAQGVTPTHAVYVVRHLQKAAGDDPPLSQEGAANAQRLSELLSSTGIRGIFATDTRRARETAAPLAARLRVPIQSYDPRNPQALVGGVAAVRGPVLVVGHSNTVPDLVARFGGSGPQSLTEQDYGTLWAIAPGGQGTITLTLPTAAICEPASR